MSAVLRYLTNAKFRSHAASLRRDYSGNCAIGADLRLGPDVAPFHDCHVLIPERSDWLAWLRLEKPEAELLRVFAAGGRTVEQVR